ncbi:hypothetical protein Q5H93_20525 [Hymenobacter sp. ASUV-10]|uniref:GtrA family protein n=1 Tax=Hymenobacter aranciens TaxID=3063996 RepID=A0ABT9BFV0_9BACT|nr:hypothetical protein [Hymenobacter sp. ASUV-10]MDO7877143.1 hypothetical protein [Hymenobacter sp. ASUV-10]
MPPKLREWAARYLPAEALSLAATLGAAALVWQATGRGAPAALAATWAGNLAFFGTIIGRDVWRARPLSWARAGRVARALLVEFGLAEVLDSFFIRPALLYYVPRWLGHFGWGVVLAKFAADVTFYVPAIIGYEFSRRRGPGRR